MNSTNAIAVLSALAQPTRLDVFRLLVRHEPEGLPAGEIARVLDVPQNTLSSHLSILATAGPLTAERRSRQIIYRVDLAVMTSLVGYLLENCCGGQACLPDIPGGLTACPDVH
jgi:DNA-binding transcriptional ArsR family regulator